MCMTWWPSKTRQGEAREGVEVWVELSVEVGVDAVLLDNTVKEGVVEVSKLPMPIEASVGLLMEMVVKHIVDLVEGGVENSEGALGVESLYMLGFKLPIETLAERRQGLGGQLGFPHIRTGFSNQMIYLRP